MKISVISPVYKSNDKDIFQNYRPIAVLSCFSKILERLMYNRLIAYLNKHNILYEHQYGFRAKHSTQQAIIELVDRITSAIVFLCTHKEQTHRQTYLTIMIYTIITQDQQ